MAEYRWSSKRVQELLEEMSGNQKNFKTKPSGKKVKNPRTGYKYVTHGYFYIDCAYGGTKLAYVMPYSSGQTDVTSGFIPSGQLAYYLQSAGVHGLSHQFKELERWWIPRQKASFEREGQPLLCRRCKEEMPRGRMLPVCEKCSMELRK
jgi:hypothetical protein